MFSRTKVVNGLYLWRREVKSLSQHYVVREENAMSELQDRHVLITGGTGSFGKKCAEILLREAPPKRLVIFSRDEQKHVDMARNLFPPSKFPQVRYFVGDNINTTITGNGDNRRVISQINSYHRHLKKNNQ